jgi:acetyl-CoA C-acetyltransferase
MITTNLPGRAVYIVDGSRTPFLKVRGRPGPFLASDLALAAGRPLLARQSFSPTQLDEVILGCVGPGPDEANIARVVALRLGCGERVPAWTVQRNCGSGMQAVDNAAQGISSGRSELVLAGGVEAMSHQPLLLDTALVSWLAAWRLAAGLPARTRHLARLRPQMLKPVVALLRGLTDPTVGLNMGQTAEQLAWCFDISRPAMDRFALESHQRLGRALESERLEEIEPIYDRDGQVYSSDDGLRPDTSLERLERLRPVFDRPVGRVSAGNSAQVSDGAAWLLLASEQALDRHDLAPLARLVDSQWAALDPAQMGLGPVHAMAPLLQRQQLDASDIDYWEINEAFAAQVLACLSAWQDPAYCRAELGLEQPFTAIPSERLNIDGGAIALGHPVGASGARILLHLVKTLQRNDARRGIACLCVGGGQGGAMLVQREEPK